MNLNAELTERETEVAYIYKKAAAIENQAINI